MAEPIRDRGDFSAPVAIVPVVEPIVPAVDPEPAPIVSIVPPMVEPVPLQPATSSNPEIAANEEFPDIGIDWAREPVLQNNRIPEKPEPQPYDPAQDLVETDFYTDPQGIPRVQIVRIALPSTSGEPEAVRAEPRTIEPAQVKAPVQTFASIATGGPPEPTGQSVRFSLFRFPVWRGSFANIDSGAEWLSQLEESQKELVKGTYVLTIRGRVQSATQYAAPMEIHNPISFSLQGKQLQLDKMTVDPANGLVRIQITIIDNPIPVIVLIGGALVSAGFAAYTLTDTLVQVDRVLDKVIVLSVIGVVVAGVWLWKVKK